MLLFEEKRIQIGLRSGIRVPRKYKAERHIDHRHLHSYFAAHAVAIVIEYAVLCLRELDVSGDLFVSLNKHRLEPGRQSALAFRRSRFSNLALGGHLTTRV